MMRLFANCCNWFWAFSLFSWTFLYAATLFKVFLLMVEESCIEVQLIISFLVKMQCCTVVADLKYNFSFHFYHVCSNRICYYVLKYCHFIYKWFCMRIIWYKWGLCTELLKWGNWIEDWAVYVWNAEWYGLYNSYPPFVDGAFLDNFLSLFSRWEDKAITVTPTFKFCIQTSTENDGN